MIVSKLARIVLVLITALYQIALSAAEFSSETIANNGEHTVVSKVLEHDIRLQIYTPDGYESSDKRYPVLYVLDGQWHFINAIGIQESLRVPDILPEMIIVGVVSDEPIRRTWFGEQREAFQQALANEVVPFVESSLRISQDKILFGWEMGAFFATFSLLEDSNQFSGIVATNGGDASVAAINEFQTREPFQKRYLYLANSDRDIYTVNYSDQLSENLKLAANKHLTWAYRKFNDETHESLPYLALYEGLKFYFHNFKDLAFTSIEEFETLGGMEYLRIHFNERSKRFGFPAGISDATKNNLIWLAWNHNNFKYFKVFMNAFKDVLATQRYDSAYWQNRFARFYLKHGEIETAQTYFENALVKFPDSHSLYEGLSEVFKSAGNKELAKKNLLKAIDIARATSDANLKRYQEQLLIIDQ